jgi:alkanesulfonate monooxygenase SsuD/methylene tetrahydromethanopterin reductase-like flavin-dependent oxidoreductase (luciferase family)
MPKLAMNFDMRLAPGAETPRNVLYETALEMIGWADERGWHSVHFAEHHSSDDGYIPSPLVMSAAAAARTKRLVIFPIVLAPFYDPVRMAEEMAVIDVISNGRFEPLLGGGYLPVEFELYGVSLAQRRALVLEAVDVLKKAWTGEPFMYRGRTVRVRPTPAQSPRPPITLGGTTNRAARQAARVADRFLGRKAHYEAFREECLRIGREDPGPYRRNHPHFLFVTEDPERSLHEIAPYVMHSLNSYSKWFQDTWGKPWSTQDGEPIPPVETVEQMKEQFGDPNGGHRLLTPDEAIALGNELAADETLAVRPLLGGIPPDVAWASLELFASKVQPHI